MRGGWADGSPYSVVDSGCRVMLVAFEFDGIPANKITVDRRRMCDERSAGLLGRIGVGLT